MTAPSFAIIIPARFASTRYPGKPLVLLRGAGGAAKSLIQRSWECASSVAGCAGVWVATDDDRIADAVVGFGGKVVMTSPDCANGTERCADAVEQLGDVGHYVVNLQGDAPLSPTHVVNQLVARLEEDRDAMMATPAVRCSPSVLKHLLHDAAANRVGGTTAVFDRYDRALYFSKRMLPYMPQSAQFEQPIPVHLHLGLYAYRPEALKLYRQAKASTLERLEGLEQLRFLDQGLAVSIVRLEPLDWDSIELNNPSDVPVIEEIMRSRGID